MRTNATRRRPNGRKDREARRRSAPAPSLPPPSPNLNADQSKASDAIEESVTERRQHLITGYAGSGKTFLMQDMAPRLQKLGLKVIASAPTHKAVAVLSAKLKSADIDVQCCTIQKLLSLRPVITGDRKVFRRKERAEPVDADVVIIDEASMLSRELMDHIDRWLAGRAVIFSGDPAQLPPVGEKDSRVFRVEPRSHLDTPQRQTRDNPIYAAAQKIRDSQGGGPDWSWCKSEKRNGHGVYLPSDADAWLRRAFLSSDFKDDPDNFRYVAWTNRRVADVNAKIRKWIYGDDIPFPFMPGEKALMRAPVMDGDDVIINTNEEVAVLDIKESVANHSFWKVEDISAWDVNVAIWRATVRGADGMDHTIDILRDTRTHSAAIERLRHEAMEERSRWRDFHQFNGAFVTAQAIYAMTVHVSQGSTHRHTFLDMMEMRHWAQADLLEAQKGIYVAATRPTTGLILV